MPSDVPGDPVRDHEHDQERVRTNEGELVTVAIYECATEGCGWRLWETESVQQSL